MNAQTQNLDLERLLAILRRRWWVIALLALLVAGSAFVFSELQTKKYTAKASVLFQTQQISQQAAGLQTGSVSFVQSEPGGHGYQRAAADAAIRRRRQNGPNRRPWSDCRGRFCCDQRVRGRADEHRNRVRDEPEPIARRGDCQHVRGTVHRQPAEPAGNGRPARTRARAATDCSALSRQQLAGPSGQALLDRAESLRILAKLQNGGVQLVSSATPPSSPSSPRVKRNTALGLLLGLVLGLGVAFLLERLDRRIRNTDELAEAYQLPLLAAVPQNKSYVLPPQIDSVAHHGDAEVFKLLRAYLRYFNVDRELRVLLVASAMPGDGKTTIAHNLAEAAQETGTKALLLESDLRRPTLAGITASLPLLACRSYWLAARRQTMRSEPCRLRPASTALQVTSRSMCSSPVIRHLTQPSCSKVTRWPSSSHGPPNTTSWS